MLAASMALPTPSLAHASWLKAPETQELFRALGEGARAVGGAVRDALIGKEEEGGIVGAKEVDVATVKTPKEVMARLRKAGIRVIPTGIKHGTVTALLGERRFEITTLRADVKTDGRHAEIRFTKHWREDAERRDFTINALYADPDGTLYDPLGGAADLEAGRVRFIGRAADRIGEDYLRILRFFRFSAFYARGDADRAGLEACFAHAEGLEILSKERIRDEVMKLLTAPRAPEMAALMAAGGIWARILPEADAEGIARHASLHGHEAAAFFSHDALLGFAAFFPSGLAAGRAARLLRMSKADAARVAAAHDEGDRVRSYLSMREVRRFLYLWGRRVFLDRVWLAWASDEKVSASVQWRALLAMGESWERPVFPLTGGMVRRAGVPEGEAVGRVLREVEEWWVESDFTEDMFSIMERLKAVVQATVY